MYHARAAKHFGKIITKT